LDNLHNDLGIILSLTNLVQEDDASHLIKVFGMAHSGRRKCISQPTEESDVIVLESGFKPLVLNKEMNLSVVMYSYDCIGSKSEIDEYVKKLASGKIDNVNPDKVKLFPWTTPMKIGKSGFWIRMEIEVTYKSETDGVFPLADKLHLECPTAVAIANGKEYFFLKSNQTLDDFDNWSEIRESITNPELVAETKVLRPLSSSGSDYGITQARILDLLYGAVQTIPLSLALHDYLDMYYVETIVNVARTRIFRERNVNTDSIVDCLLKWTPVDDLLFKELYEKKYLGPKVRNSQEFSVKNFHEDMNRKNVVSPLKGKSLNTLYYHATKIQNTLDEIRQKFVRGNSGLEVELAYRTLFDS
jgi:hypothetical protein